MPSFDDFAGNLLEQSKRFLERAVESEADGKAAYTHAALMLAFCSLEAHVNAIADDFSSRVELTPHDRMVLYETDVKLEDGVFVNSKKLKISRLEDRIQFVCARFSSKRVDNQCAWWGRLSGAIDLRNKLTHPKDATLISTDDVKRALEAIVDGLDYLYQSIYGRGFPSAGRGTQSKLTF